MTSFVPSCIYRDLTDGADYIEGGSSPNTGAPRPWIGYPARAGTVKKEILNRGRPRHGGVEDDGFPGPRAGL